MSVIVVAFDHARELVRLIENLVQKGVLRTYLLIIRPTENFRKAKNKNETCSNLSLGTRLTRVKRLSRERCCDTTSGRCQEGNRLTILFCIL